MGSKRSIFTGLVALSLFFASVSAEVTDADSATTAPVRMRREAAQRSAGHAFLLSVANTVGPILIGSYLLGSQSLGSLGTTVGSGLEIFGLFGGPSIGNYYLDDAFGGNIGLASRVGGAAAMTVGFVLALECAFIQVDSDQNKSCNSDVGPAVFMIGGAGAFFGGTIWNLFRLPGAAERYNRIESASSDRAQPQAPALQFAALPIVNLRDQAVGMRFTMGY